MPIRPEKLHRIATNDLMPLKLKTLRRVNDLGNQNLTRYIRFTLAGSTRTGPPQPLKAQISFAAITPGQGKLIPDHGNILQFDYTHGC